VIATSRAKVVSALDHRARTIAEDMVNTAMGGASVDPVHEAIQGLNPRRVRLSIEVTDEDDHIVLVRVLSNHPHDVVRSSRARTTATLADWQRAVVIHKENDFPLLVLKASPLRRAFAVPLLAGILTNVLLTRVEQSPTRLPIS